MTAITVTAQHIAEGLQDSCELCPVALAIRDAIRDSGVWVDSRHVTFGKRGHWIEVDLPDAVTAFIEAFDRGQGGEPFSFDLDFPAEVAA